MKIFGGLRVSCFMNGIIYCRVSSKEQIEGTSLESQQAACKEYARLNNITVLKVFVEQGESAKFADRTQLLELIDFCRQNKGNLQVLLVWKVDRFARNVGDHFSVKASLLKYGVRIVSVTEPIDSNPEGKLMETILAGFAQFDNDIRAMRTVQGMRRKLQEGIFPWKAPLGYKSSVENDEKKTEPDLPNQPLFGLLQKAWKEFATGAYTKAEIRRRMDNWGIQTENGRALSAQSTDNFFRNRYYAGILLDPWSGEEYEGKHVPMVTPEEYARVQQIVSRGNRSIPHQKERPEFPLRGFARCRDCLHYLTASFSRGRSRRYPYYHCNKKTCQSRGSSYPVQLIHAEFEEFLDQVAPKPDLLEKLGEQMAEEAEQRQAALKTKKVRLDAERLSLKRELQELIGMKSRQLITDEEFLAQKSLLLQKRAALEAKQVDNDLDAEQVRRHLTEIKEPLVRLRETWDDLPFPFQRRFERLVLPAGFVQGKIRTAETGLLFAVFGDHLREKSTGVPPAGALWNRVLAEIKAFWQLFTEYRAGSEASQRRFQCIQTNNPREAEWSRQPNGRTTLGP